MKNIEEIRAHFSKDRFAKNLGIYIETANDQMAVCSVDVTDDQMNALGRVQGGLLFTLADFTFAVAANTREMGTVTLESAIHYLAPPKGKRLVATAKPKNVGGRISVYEVDIEDESGKLVACLTATGYKTGK